MKFVLFGIVFIGFFVKSGFHFEIDFLTLFESLPSLFLNMFSYSFFFRLNSFSLYFMA